MYEPFYPNYGAGTLPQPNILYVGPGIEIGNNNPHNYGTSVSLSHRVLGELCRTKIQTITRDLPLEERDAINDLLRSTNEEDRKLGLGLIESKYPRLGSIIADYINEYYTYCWDNLDMYKDDKIL